MARNSNCTDSEVSPDCLFRALSRVSECNFLGNFKLSQPKMHRLANCATMLSLSFGDVIKCENNKMQNESITTVDQVIISVRVKLQLAL